MIEPPATTPAAVILRDIIGTRMPTSKPCSRFTAVHGKFATVTWRRTDTLRQQHMPETHWLRDVRRKGWS